MNNAGQPDENLPAVLHPNFESAARAMEEVVEDLLQVDTIIEAKAVKSP